MSCLICAKHKNFRNLVITETAHSIASHFPIIDGANPVLGYLLIEPKRHIISMSEMTKDEAADLGTLSVRLTNLLEREMRAEQVYLFKLADVVPHVHFHILPRFKGTPKEYWGLAARDWPEAKRGDHEAISSLAQNLAKAL